MSTKLTLSIDSAVIRQAKAFARHRRKSLSKLVEEYLRFVSADAGHAPPISNRVLAVAETLEMPPGVSYDDLREQYLREKLLGGGGDHGACGPSGVGSELEHRANPHSKHPDDNRHAHMERITALDAIVTAHLKPSAESQASTCPKASCCH